jgi:hypothetical protein
MHDEALEHGWQPLRKRLAYFLCRAESPKCEADFPISSTTLSPDFGDKVKLSTVTQSECDRRLRGGALSQVEDAARKQVVNLDSLRDDLLIDAKPNQGLD